MAIPCFMGMRSSDNAQEDYVRLERVLYELYEVLRDMFGIPLPVRRSGVSTPASRRQTDASSDNASRPGPPLVIASPARFIHERTLRLHWASCRSLSHTRCRIMRSATDVPASLAHAGGRVTTNDSIPGSAPSGVQHAVMDTSRHQGGDTCIYSPELKVMYGANKDSPSSRSPDANRQISSTSAESNISYNSPISPLDTEDSHLQHSESTNLNILRLTCDD